MEEMAWKTKCEGEEKFSACSGKHLDSHIAARRSGEGALGIRIFPGWYDMPLVNYHVCTHQCINASF